MADNIDKSLDEIITAKRRGGFRGRGRRGGRGRGRGRGASTNRGRSGAPVRRGRGRGQRGGSFNRPTENQSPGGKWQHDMYQGGGRGGGMSLRTGTRGGKGSKLLISNLDYGVSDSDIRELFSDLGTLIKTEVHYDKSGRSLGTANVIYVRHTDAIKAKNEYDGVPLDGRPMTVQLLTGTPQAQASAGGGTPRGGSRPRGGGKQQNTSGGTWRSGGGGGGRVSRGRGGRGRGGRGRGGFQKTPVPTADELDAELDAYKGSGEAMES